MIVMQAPSQGLKAYEATSRFRSQRDQEADVFRRATSALKAAREAGAITRIRALADNRRLWITVSDLMRDAANALPEPTRAGIISLGLAVHREMDQELPDFGFLIAVNETLSAGLLGQP